MKWLAVLALAACGSSAAAPAPRCTVRVSPKGLYVDGSPTQPDAAVAVCKRASEAILLVEDGADGKPMTAALERAHIRVIARGILDDKECLENPLAKGCS